MNLFGRDYQGFAKWLVLFVMVLLIAGGLCGMQFALVSAAGEKANVFEGFFMLTGIVELGAILISLLGIVVVAVAWPIAKLSGYTPPQYRSEKPLSILDDQSENDSKIRNDSEDNR